MKKDFVLEDKTEWARFATFVPNKHLPVYNWFYYKEGFSRFLVSELLKKFKIKKGLVLDPFCGVGTTNLVCKEKGIDSVGFDISPIALFAARVKTRDYDVEKLKRTLSKLKKVKFKKPDILWISSKIRRFFNKHTLDDIVFFMDEVKRIDDPVVRDFFHLALITTAVRTSYIYKDGSVVKIRKHPVPPFRKVYFARTKRMMYDLKKIEFRPCKTIIEKCDARMMKLDNNVIDAIITSPPYLNKIEYTKIYRIEELLFFGIASREIGIRSYIGLKADTKKLFPELPDVANAYFSDMKKVLEEMWRVTKDNVKIAIVVGNGCFSNRVVESDILLSYLARDIGFRVKKIIVLNKRWCMKNRVVKVGKLRESLLIMEK
ncbi:MAG: hypothetical protein J7K72_01980 [Candidatus Aenigmarchaeota archaeon]|nr:hypothetical protein [Candidatus Aenigmarchaeota archaeon]